MLLLLMNGAALFAQKLVLNTVGFKLSEEQRSQIQMLAEYEASLYNGLFSTTRNDSLQIYLNMYQRFSDYKKISQDAGGRLISATGFYSPSLRQVFIYKHDEFMRTLVHEMSHCFMHYNVKSVPRWLNEGVAVFFESMEVRYNTVEVSVQRDRLGAVRKYIAGDNLDLSAFLQLPLSVWQDKSKLDYLYNVSYSIVFYLMKSNPAYARQLILELSKGKSSVEAIESLPYGDLAQFERRYKLFYR